MSKLLSILVCMALLGLIASCVGENNSPLMDSTCGAPCWRGINMGATKEEVVANLGIMTDVDQETITSARTNRPYLEEEVHWRFHPMEEVGNIILQKNKVIALYFPLRKRLSLSSLIKRYGQPDSIILIKEQLDNIYVTVYILYQQSGVCLVHKPSLFPFYNPKSYNIRPSSSVSEVYYADYTIPDWQTNFGCEGGFDKDVYSKSAQDWHGYGNYSIYGGNR